MRLEHWYRATWVTPEAWSVELAGEVRPREGGGFEAVADVSELVWEPIA